MHIIIASDSRGRGFPQYIQSHQPFPLHWKISLLIRPGATITKLTRETENILKLENNSQSTNVMFLPEFATLLKKLIINLGQKFVIIHIKKFKTQFRRLINLFRSFRLSIAKYSLQQYPQCH